MPPTIRIRIVAAVDQSLANVFVPVAAAAKRAGAQIGAGLAAGATVGAGAYRSMPAQVGAPLAQAGRQGKQFQEVMGSVADGTIQKFRALSDGLKAIPADLKVVAAEAQKELAKIERMKARDALGLNPRVVSDTRRPAFWSTNVSSEYSALGGGALRLGMNAASFGVRLGADLLHGAGVHTDLASIVAGNVGIEKRAQDVSNFGFMNSGPNARRVDPGELAKQARTVAVETGNEADTVLEGLEKFTGLTGDLKTGREVIKDLAVLSKATGSNVMQMAEAAGNASNVLGDMPNKGQAVYEVMKAIAGEGKTGAILIKDMAVQMAKVAAGAQQFQGDRSRNIALLGAIAQEARGRGGSASAAQAATSVASFVNTFSKGARIQAFHGFGVELQGKGGGLRAANDIIIDSLNAAMKGGRSVNQLTGKVKVHQGGQGNFSENLGAMFMDVRARSAVRGFESIYREAYGKSTQEKESEKMADASAAVRQEFERLMGAAMSEEVVQKEFQLAMGTTASKVSVFNTQIGAAVGEMQGELIPAMLELAPAAVEAAKGLAHLVEWLTGHQDKAKVESDLAQNNVTLAAADALRAGQERRARGTEEAKRTDPDFIGPLPPAAFEIPKGMPEQVSAEAKEREGKLAEARKNFEYRRVALERNAPGGTLDPTASATGDYTDELARAQKLAAGGPSSAQANAAEYLKAFDSLKGAQQDNELTSKIAAAFKEALATSHLTVDIGKMPPAKEGTSVDVGNGASGKQLPASGL